MTPLDRVRDTYRAARYADRHYPERFICDAYREHLVAITDALRAGFTGTEINQARRIA